MSSLACHPVSTFRQRRAFLQLERTLYRDDPNWVPPIWDERKRLCGFKHHPFYIDNKCQAFLATRGSEVVGRIVAIINRDHNERYNEQRGFFGFFESINDRDVAECLFETAGQWLRDQGMTDVRGPVNPSLNYECGLLIKGFDSPPTFLIPHNLEYYGDLIEACGFEKCQDLFSYDAHMDTLEDLDPKLMFVINEATK
ncbi:N-acetyltransferase, partial [Rubripirellula amarantea]|nr:N-acetyltransferase [Rubripirellula amarantea]